MDNIDIRNNAMIVTRLREQAARDAIKITIHGYQEMVNDAVSMDDLRGVLMNATVLENYPEHKRGPCCLVCGRAGARYIHVVCTTSHEVAIIITVYEPKPPKWPTPFERGERK